MTTRFVAISDTHNRLNKINVPDGDVLIHAGDACGRGTIQELARFNKELNKLPHSIKIFIPGNHDRCCETDTNLSKNAILTNVTHFLIDEQVEINGVKIYGSPWQPEFYNWAFNLPRGEQLKEKWGAIPTDTNILITHGPPANILDRTIDLYNAGCVDLAERIKKLKKLKYHLFGHIHEGHGIFKDKKLTYANVSICNYLYIPNNKPFVFDL